LTVAVYSITSPVEREQRRSMLITNSNFVGWTTGRSAGFRRLSTLLR
jgi:hypothetical protein